MKEKSTPEQTEKWNSMIDRIEKHMGELAREYMEKSFLLELIKDFRIEELRKERKENPKPDKKNATEIVHELINPIVKGLEGYIKVYDAKEKDKEYITSIYESLSKILNQEGTANDAY